MPLLKRQFKLAGGGFQEPFAYLRRKLYTRLLRQGATFGLWFSSKSFILCCRERAFSFDVTAVCFLSVTDSLVAAMISCPMINRKRSDNMDNNFFIMAYLEILLYKNNNTVGKKLRDSLKKSWIKILLVFLISIVEM